MNNSNDDRFDSINLKFLQEKCDDTYPSNGDNDIVHDDGNLHITYQGLRYVFGIGQDLSNAKYNAEANRIFRSAGIRERAVGQNN